MAARLSLVPCTACRYCYDCPKKLDIPRLIAMHNEGTFDMGPVMWGVQGLAEEQKPHNCISCGTCMKACPQAINIPDVLRQFDEAIKKAGQTA